MKKNKKNWLLDIEVQEAIIDLRVRHGLTQAKLAKKMGVTQPDIARAESQGIASIHFLQRIGDAVGEKVSIGFYADSKLTLEK